MRCRLLVIFMVMISVVASFAAVPQTINYQGHLANSGGSPVNSAVDMTFTIYNAATDGTNFWTEGQTVQVNNGIYAVALGAINPVDPAIIDGDLWLGVRVGTDAEMTPRQQLNSVPFAFLSAKTEDPVLLAIKKKSRGDLSYLIDEGDGTLTDPISGLVWTQNLFYGQTWDAAYSNCDALVLGGQEDWRMPESVELYAMLQDGFSILSFPFTGITTDVLSFQSNSVYTSSTFIVQSYKTDAGSDYFFRVNIGSNSKTSTLSVYSVCVRN